MRKAFTLAEVLITLAIIGIVAALTIPSVISNYQQQEFKTGLKKAVSVLNEAIQMNISQDGETPYQNGDLFTYLQRHINVIKTGELNTCRNFNTGELIKSEDIYGGCQGGATNNKIFYTADGMRFEITDKISAKPIILHETGEDANEKSDSATWRKSGYCGSKGLINNPHNTEHYPCVLIVDVNGDKKPNPPIPFIGSKYFENILANGDDWSYTKVGNQQFEYTYPSPTDKKLQDIFTIMITDEKAIPFGVVAQRAMYSK